MRGSTTATVPLVRISLNAMKQRSTSQRLSLSTRSPNPFPPTTNEESADDGTAPWCADE
jgi:hypothetical protein